MTEQLRFVHCTPDAERLIVKMARVSNPSNDENWDTGPKLLRYLIKHKHWSPFEMASLCVLIETETGEALHSSAEISLRPGP